jgi:hypothetical protein
MKAEALYLVRVCGSFAKLAVVRNPGAAIGAAKCPEKLTPGGQRQGSRPARGKALERR